MHYSVRIPNSRGHTKAWESVSPTQGATQKRGSPYPQLKGPHQSVGVCIPNSRGHTKAWESISVGVHHPNSRGPQRGGANCEPVILNSTRRLTIIGQVSSIALEGRTPTLEQIGYITPHNRSLVKDPILGVGIKNSPKSCPMRTVRANATSFIDPFRAHLGNVFFVIF